VAEVNGCNIPEDRYYWAEKHVWVSVDEGGVATVGVTDVAQALAKKIISALPKAAGRSTKKGRSLGTIESGKWVGPVTSPITGEIIETNPGPTRASSTTTLMGMVGLSGFNPPTGRATRQIW